MTWVIGRAGPFGYAVGLSDIRVTLGNGAEVDCLQKIYRVGPNLALGFAGSVKIGLRIAEELGAGLYISNPDYAHDPKIIAKYLFVGAQKIFESFPPKIRGAHCHLMLLSAHPQENDGAAPWAKCYVHRFYSPDFQPHTARTAEIVSIGSGGTVNHYAQALRKLKFDIDLFKMEPMEKHGSAYGLLLSITSTINKTRIKGISNHLHICLIGRDGVKLGRNDLIKQSNPEENLIMPPVAQSWGQLVEILRSKDVAKSAIELARC